MSFSYNGRVFLTDSEGFLLNKDEWSENLMLFMAQNLGLTLTEQHKIVIYEVRAYYKEERTYGFGVISNTCQAISRRSCKNRS